MAVMRCTPIRLSIAALATVVVSVGAGGCCAIAPHHAPCAFVRAEVRRVGVRPEYATAVTLTGERLEALLRFLPGVGRGRSSSFAEASVAGYFIELHRANGQKVLVSVSHGLTTWSEGKGSHWLDEGFGRFIAEVMPVPATGTAQGDASRGWLGQSLALHGRGTDERGVGNVWRVY